MYFICAVIVLLALVSKTSADLIVTKPNPSTGKMANLIYVSFELFMFFHKVIDGPISLKEHLANIVHDGGPPEAPKENTIPELSETINLNENVDLKPESSTYYGFNSYRTPYTYGYPYYDAWYRENYYNRPYFYPYGAPYGGFYRRNDYYSGNVENTDDL